MMYLIGRNEDYTRRNTVDIRDDYRSKFKSIFSALYFGATSVDIA